MAEIPEKIQVGAVTYTVKEDINDLRALVEDSVSHVGGCVNYPKLQICLNPEFSTSWRPLDLFHELIHTCMESAGLHMDSSSTNDQRERIVHGLAPVLFETIFRRNPKLVAYLVAEDDNG